MPVEQRELRAAMHRIRGLVDVQRERAGRGREAHAEPVHHRPEHRPAGGLVGGVLQPVHGRLGAQAGTGLRLPTERHEEGRVAAQRVEIGDVLVARRDGEHPRAQHVADAVRHPGRIAAVGHEFGQPVDEPEAPLDRRQQGNADVGGLRAAVEGGDDGLSARGWHHEKRRRGVGHDVWLA